MLYLHPKGRGAKHAVFTLRSSASPLVIRFQLVPDPAKLYEDIQLTNFIRHRLQETSLNTICLLPAIHAIVTLRDDMPSGCFPDKLHPSRFHFLPATPPQILQDGLKLGLLMSDSLPDGHTAIEFKPKCGLPFRSGATHSRSALLAKSLMDPRQLFEDESRWAVWLQGMKNAKRLSVFGTDDFEGALSGCVDLLHTRVPLLRFLCLHEALCEGSQCDIWSLHSEESVEVDWNEAFAPKERSEGDRVVSTLEKREMQILETLRSGLQGVNLSLKESFELSCRLQAMNESYVKDLISSEMKKTNNELWSRLSARATKRYFFGRCLCDVSLALDLQGGTCTLLDVDSKPGKLEE